MSRLILCLLGLIACSYENIYPWTGFLWICTYLRFNWVQGIRFIYAHILKCIYWHAPLYRWIRKLESWQSNEILLNHEWRTHWGWSTEPTFSCHSKVILRIPNFQLHGGRAQETFFPQGNLFPWRSGCGRWSDSDFGFKVLDLSPPNTFTFSLLLLIWVKSI